MGLSSLKPRASVFVKRDVMHMDEIRLEEGFNSLSIFIHGKQIDLVHIHGHNWLVLKHETLSEDEIKQLFIDLARSEEFMDFLVDKQIYLNHLFFQEEMH